jgi:hypothetical protein
MSTGVDPLREKIRLENTRHGTQAWLVVPSDGLISSRALRAAQRKLCSAGLDGCGCGWTMQGIDRNGHVVRLVVNRGWGGCRVIGVSGVAEGS